MWVKWKLISVHFDIVVISMQDVGGDSVNLDARQCMVCAKCIIGSEIILDAPDGTLT